MGLQVLIMDSAANSIKKANREKMVQIMFEDFAVSRFAAYTVNPDYYKILVENSKDATKSPWHAGSIAVFGASFVEGGMVAKEEYDESGPSICHRGRFACSAPGEPRSPLQ